MDFFKRLYKLSATNKVKLILSLIIVTTSACGGGNDPEVVDLGEPVDADRLPLGTFNFPVNELNYNFDEVLQMDYWNHEVWNGDPAAVEVFWEQNSGQLNPSVPDDRGAMIVSPRWGTEFDQIAVMTDFEQDVTGLDEDEIDAVDLLCADIRASVFIPESYVEDGNMGFKFFVKDSDENFADFGWNSSSDMEANAWNTLIFQEITPESLEFADEGFNLSSVRFEGIVFDANGKIPAVGGDLRVDNIQITPKAIQDCVAGDLTLEDLFLTDFEQPAQVDQWNNPFLEGDMALDVSHDPDNGNPGGAIRFSPVWANGSQDKASIERPLNLDGSVNLLEKTVRVDMYVPESYVEDGNMGFQIFTKDSQFRYGNFGFEPVSGMTPGWNTFEYANLENEKLPTAFWADGYDITDIMIIGVELISNGKPISVTGDILVDNVRIADLVESSGAGTKILSDNFDQPSGINAWEFDFAEGSLMEASVQETHNEDFGEGSLELNIDWGASNDKLMWRRIFEGPDGGPIDLIGTVVRVDIYIPAAYVEDGNMGIKIFTKDINWEYGSLGWNGIASFEGDAWNTIEINVTGGDVFDFTNAGYDSSQVDKIGVEFVANGKSASIGGAFLIDNVEIIRVSE